MLSQPPGLETRSGSDGSEPGTAAGGDKPRMGECGAEGCRWLATVQCPGCQLGCYCSEPCRASDWGRRHHGACTGNYRRAPTPPVTPRASPVGTRVSPKRAQGSPLAREAGGKMKDEDRGFLAGLRQEADCSAQDNNTIAIAVRSAGNEFCLKLRSLRVVVECTPQKGLTVKPLPE